LTEEADLDRLADLDSLSLLYEDLACVLAPVPAIQTRHPVLLWVISLLERLEGGHQVVATGNTVGDHSLGDSGGHGALDDGSNGVHRPDHLGLVLGWDVELDLLEEVFRGTEATHDQHILKWG
jgi:hypothetical protein